MQNFFHPEFRENNQLPQAEAHHVQHVLRMKVGDRIRLVNGKGHATTASLSLIDKNGVQFSVEDEIAFHEPGAWDIRLAFAPVKSADRLEWIIEKCVEIGVSGFDLVFTARTERNQAKAERLEKIAVSAMKQSGRFWLPTLRQFNSVSDFLPHVQSDIKLLADLETEMASEGWERGKNSFCIFVGPEGDFTPDERKLIQQSGFLGVSLSDKVLRTETACVVGVDMIHWKKRWEN